MGDHFVLLVDRLLTESTLEAVIQSKSRLLYAAPSLPGNTTTSFPLGSTDFNLGSSFGKLADCRICYQEDENSRMEIPCSCRGSLMYAHRKCVQRWCNEKGDTTCEICLQQFQPDYTAPPPLFHYGNLPMNFRGNFVILQSDLNSRMTRMVSHDEDFLDPSFEEFPIPNTSRSLVCCRIVAFILMFLLVLHHTLPPLFMYSAGGCSVSFFMVLIARAIGILLPVYVIAEASTAFRHRHNRQAISGSSWAPA